MEHCIALSGKGAPGATGLEDAVEAIRRSASGIHERTRRRGHDWKPADPEILLRAPAGTRGGRGWTVRLAVPSFVTARDVREAASRAATRLGVAKNIRLVPLDAKIREPPAVRPGRDRLPGQIRRVRTGAPQHKARELPRT